MKRRWFGKSKKKGGPRKHPLKRGLFGYRVIREDDSTDSNSTSTSESSESINSSEGSGNSSMESESSSSSESTDSSSSGDHKLNATAVKRRWFGKSKKKGGPRKHPLKRGLV